MFDAALISLVADLEETVSAPGRAGLAANQIGVSRRVFAYDVDGLPKRVRRFTNRWSLRRVANGDTAVTLTSRRLAP